MPLYNPANVFPAPWRGILTWAFALIFVFFCYFGWWLSFAALREKIWWLVTSWFFFSGILFQILKRWPRRTGTAPTTPPPGTQEGGWYFLGFIALMLIWWVVSTI